MEFSKHHTNVNEIWALALKNEIYKYNIVKSNRSTKILLINILKCTHSLISGHIGLYIVPHRS